VRRIVVLVLLMNQLLCFAQMASGNIISKKDTIGQNLQDKGSFRYPQLILPATLMLAGLTLNGNGPKSLKNKIVAERNQRWSDFSTNVDDYLQYSPVVMAYGLDVFGSESYTDIQNRTAIFIKGELCMIAVTQLLKHTTHIQRPDYSNYNSFPSGHTAQAFAAATFLSQEYQYKYTWIPYASYGIASSVGILRMANNKHFISDVLVGAGIGILSMKLSYWTHQYKWNKNKRIVNNY